MKRHLMGKLRPDAGSVSGEVGPEAGLPDGGAGATRACARSWQRRLASAASRRSLRPSPVDRGPGPLRPERAAVAPIWPDTQSLTAPHRASRAYAVIRRGQGNAAHQVGGPAPRPGRRLIRGEAMLAALRRECREETGWSIRVERRLGASHSYTCATDSVPRCTRSATSTSPCTLYGSARRRHLATRRYGYRSTMPPSVSPVMPRAPSLGRPRSGPARASYPRHFLPPIRWKASSICSNLSRFGASHCRINS